jgi:hypothetical protein
VRTYIVERVLQLRETVHDGLEATVRFSDGGRDDVLILPVVSSYCCWVNLDFVLRLFKC